LQGCYAGHAPIEKSQSLDNPIQQCNACCLISSGQQPNLYPSNREIRLIFCNCSNPYVASYIFIFSFLILPTHNRHRTVLQFLFQILIHSERDRLTGSNPHDPRRDTFIESVESFLSISHVSQFLLVIHQRIRSTYRNISLAIVVILLKAVSPGCAGVFCNLVLIVSIGALESGPIAPETRPMRVVW
jgi:hypothetical protein